GIPQGPAASSQPHASSKAKSRNAAIRWSCGAPELRHVRANTSEALARTRFASGCTSLPAASSASTIGDRPSAMPSPSTAADNATPKWLNLNRRIPGAPSRPNRFNQVDHPNSMSSASAASHQISGYRVRSEGLRSDEPPLSNDGEQTGNTTSRNS